MPQGGDFQSPSAPQPVPGLPENFHLLRFDGFAGLNTKPTRPAIKDQEMATCDNWMPLGENNLRTLYDIGPAAYTATSGHSVAFFGFGNISDTPISVIAESDGSLHQLNTSTMTATLMAPANTIVNT